MKVIKTHKLFLLKGLALLTFSFISCTKPKHAIATDELSKQNLVPTFFKLPPTLPGEVASVTYKVKEMQLL